MPCTLVATFVVTPVATFVIETVALGMAAPDSSVTVPERLPPTICAYPGMDARKQGGNTIRAIQPTKTLSNLVRAFMIFVILISPLTEVPRIRKEITVVDLAAYWNQAAMPSSCARKIRPGDAGHLISSRLATVCSRIRRMAAGLNSYVF